MGRKYSIRDQVKKDVNFKKAEDTKVRPQPNNHNKSYNEWKKGLNKDKNRNTGGTG